MTLENQVCSLELSKKLKELGVKQDGIFQWRKYSLNPEPFVIFFGEAQSGKELGILSGEFEYWYSAFTVAELGEMLPDHLNFEGKVWLLKMIKNPIEFGLYYDTLGRADYIGTKNGGCILEDTEADARAKMLIYLLESRNINLTK